MDTGWVTKCDPQVARDVRDLLEEVLKEMDLLKDRIVISAFPKRVHETYSPEHTARVIAEKIAVAEMLVKRGALKAMQAFDDPRLHANPRRGIVILADRAEVEVVLDAFMQPGQTTPVPSGRAPARLSLPKNQQDALPREPEPLEELRRRTHTQEQVKCLYWFGGIILVTALSLLLKPVREWASHGIEGIWGLNARISSSADSLKKQP